METAGVDSAGSAGQPQGRPSAPARPRRWALLAALALAAAVGAVLLAIRWQERTFREAQRELREGDPRRALALVSYFLDGHPGHGGALALKARALAAAGQPEAAIELFEQVGAASVEDLHAWARAYLVLESWSRALPLLTTIVQQEPNHADGLHELTACRVRLGLLREAAASAEALSRVPGEEAKGFVFLGAIHNDLGSPKESLQAYRRAVELAPDGQGLQVPPEELFTQFGVVLVNMGQTASAVEQLQKSLACRPTAAAYYYLGEAQSQAGKSEEAEKAWRKAVELDPAGVSSREGLANLAILRGDTDAALEWLGPLERVAQTRHKTAYLFQRVCMKRKDEAGAQRWRKKAEALRKVDQRVGLVQQLMTQAPHSFWANVALAHHFASQGNWRQAADMLDELAPEAPDDKFVQALADAVRKRGPLPPLEQMPVQQH